MKTKVLFWSICMGTMHVLFAQGIRNKNANTEFVAKLH